MGGALDRMNKWLNKSEFHSFVLFVGAFVAIFMYVWQELNSGHIKRDLYSVI